MDTYHEHPRHCKLWRYEVELCGTVGKDAARHQSRPTSHCEERCFEPLLDVILLQRCQTRMLHPSSHVKRVSLLRGSHSPVSEGGHLSPCLPQCHLRWDLRLLHILFSSGLVTLRGFYCYEPQSQTRICSEPIQQHFTSQTKVGRFGEDHGYILSQVKTKKNLWRSVLLIMSIFVHYVKKGMLLKIVL